MTLFLAERLRRLHWRIAVISRGYKARAEKRGGIVSDGRKIVMTEADAGDEPALLASKLLPLAVPVLVGRNRRAAGLLAVRLFRPDILLLDDAFQHLQVSRDLDLVLLDGRRPFGNGRLLPRGPLREPVAALARGDIFVLTRTETDDAAAVERLRRIVGDRPVYAAVHNPYVAQWVPANEHHRQVPPAGMAAVDLGSLRGKSVYGFSGIAANEDFKQTLATLGCHLVGFTGFADHHRYATDELAALVQAAARSGAELICTTEKDYVRIGRRMPTSVDLAVIGIEMSLRSRQADFIQAVVGRLGSGAGG
jgi:tetraacyldisaccharide 4'-kinase